MAGNPGFAGEDPLTDRRALTFSDQGLIGLDDRFRRRLLHARQCLGCLERPADNLRSPPDDGRLCAGAGTTHSADRETLVAVGFGRFIGVLDGASPICPIARTSSMMRDRDDEDLFTSDKVED